MSDRKIALVFAGAGASTAVSPEDYPTTVGFYERLPEAIRAHPTVKAAHQWFQERIRRGSEAIDIEVVLWAVDELTQYLERLRAARDFPNFVLRNDLLTEWTKRHQAQPTPTVAKIVGHYPNLLSWLGQLRSEIAANVYQFYAKLPSRQSLEATWLPLLEGLLAANYTLELATTNYDLVLESAIEALGPNRGPGTGRAESGIYRHFDLSLWQNPLSSTGLLTKLHGSVDWSWDTTGRLLVGTPLFTGDPSRHLIIYPGFKGAPERSELQLFHNYFAQTVAAANLLVFVGFAFRDSYLNQLLTSNIGPEARVLVINPATNISDMPFQEGKGHFTHCVEPFGAEVVNEVLRDLSTRSRQ